MSALLTANDNIGDEWSVLDMAFDYDLEVEDNEELSCVVVSIVNNRSEGVKGRSKQPLCCSSSSASLKSIGSSKSDGGSSISSGFLSASDLEEYEDVWPERHNKKCADNDEGDESLGELMSSPWYSIQMKGHCYHAKKTTLAMGRDGHETKKKLWLKKFGEKLLHPTAQRNRFDINNISQEMREELKKLYVY